jgi:hypothetical protein
LAIDPTTATTTATKLTVKRLGDKPFKPKTQKLGTFTSAETCFEAEVFKKLARAYIVEGDEMEQMCMANMQAAMDARKPHVAQIWMLMAMALRKRVVRAPSPLLLPTPLRS